MIAQLALALLLLTGTTSLTRVKAPASTERWALLATGGDNIAVSGRPGLFLSTDGGASFARLSKLPAQPARLAISEDGTLYVASGKTLTTRDAAGKVRAMVVKGVRSIDEVVAAGSAVILRATMADQENRYLSSTDHGATFTPRWMWQTGNFRYSVTLTSAGAIALIAGMEAPCGGGGQSRQFGRVSDEQLEDAPWGIDAPTDFTATESAWAYALDTCDQEVESNVLCAVGPDGPRMVTLEPPLPQLPEGLVATSRGATTWLAIEGLLVRAEADTGRVVSTAVPKGLTQLATTADGGVWALADGRLYRFDGALFGEVSVRRP